jgi:aquaporin Z
LLWATFNGSPSYNRTKTGLGADGYGSASHLHVTQGGAFLVEVILTAIFVFVVLSVTGKKGTGPISGVAIGLSLAMVHLVGIPLTGTSVNPARSLGPAVVVGGTAMSQVWLFLVAPLAGAVVAAVLHRFFESGAEAN